MLENEIKIIIATHKISDMPEDKLYIPVQVGAEGKDDLGYVRDCTGDNISEMNNHFCELTGLYWGWKNFDYDYLGLAHYRRHFKGKKRGNKILDKVISFNELNVLVDKYKIFVPKKRKYYIETLYSHYANTFSKQHLDCAKEIIYEKYPDYINSFDKVMNQRSGFMFNMFIMRKEFVNEYCTWLFDILFELDKRIDSTGMSSFEARFCGRVSEILFNVWLNKKIADGNIDKKDIKELGWIYIGKVNIFKKGVAFLKAKFFKEKYKESF